MAIQSFSDKTTEAFFIFGKKNRRAGWNPVSKIAKRKLDLLHYAVELSDLKSPPGNQLEALKGSLAGWHSIRINNQWRIIFKWSSVGPSEVKIIDYH